LEQLEPSPVISVAALIILFYPMIEQSTQNAR
jgi:hypothetical protein